jgi:hypothetical protein
MRERKDKHKIVIRKPERKEPIPRPRHRWES